MKKELHDMRKVFAFTLRAQLRQKKYRAAVIVVCLVLFLLPVAVMGFLGKDTGDSKVSQAATGKNPVAQVCVADETGLGLTGFETLQVTEGENGRISWQIYGSLAEAESRLEGTSDGLILLLERKTEEIQMHLLIPEGSSLEKEDCQVIQNLLDREFSTVLAESAGVSAGQIQQAAEPVQTQAVTVGEENASEADSARDMLSSVMPYIFIMVLYFMVLIYGQQVAGSVIMEKSSKLMDTFLTSVKPVSMIFGKVFAIVCSSILQFALWVAALILGLFAGNHILTAGSGAAGALGFLAENGWFREIFSVPGMILAVLLLLSGFLLYCALASIGGSAAGKTEDLSSTNVLFTMILVISFLVSLAAGGVGLGGGEAASAWVYWVPFTSVLTLPGRLMLGEVSLITGVGSLAVSIAATVVILVLAARIYKMMALYKGTPPNPARLFAMLREKQQ